MKRKKLTKKEKIRRHKLTKGYLDKQEKRKFKRNTKEWKRNIKSRDKLICQKCGKDLTKLNDNGKQWKKDPHHIISFESVKRKYPELNTDLNNGILLCSYCHKRAPDSPHQGGFEFTVWLMKNKPGYYNYLLKYLEQKGYK